MEEDAACRSEPSWEGSMLYSSGGKQTGHREQAGKRSRKVVMVCLHTGNLWGQFCKWSSLSTETNILQSTVVHGLIAAPFIQLLSHCQERKGLKDIDN